MIQPSDIYISEQSIAALTQAAIDLQVRNGIAPEQIEQALVSWLESGIESLADDVLWYLQEGSGNAVIGRKEFERRVQS
ncbi:hypothetical protein IFO70_18960 [Phormidium tenue FACHB-886]|nr:hypothetical protein [Phormidium tenue FACHB-886]